MADLYHGGSPSQRGSHCDATDTEAISEPEPKDGSQSSSTITCAVCLEGVELVAYGQCAHPDVVCADCAIRIRSLGQGDHCCCICRMPCPTILITKERAAGASGRHWKRLLPPKGEGRVGEYWYYEQLAAYFDNEEQYKKEKKLMATAAESGFSVREALFIVLTTFLVSSILQQF